MILAIVQARVSSSRLPGKVLLPILGKTMLERQLERISRAKRIDRLIVATSTDHSDDPLAEVCAENGLECFRGSLENVLDRFYQAASSRSADHVVRLTGDCPLTDPGLIDEVIEFHLRGGFDFTSNAAEPTFPDGLDAAVISFPALKRSWECATTPAQREHVTLYINQNRGLFKVGLYKNSTDLSHLRWTVDEPRDFEFVTKIYEELYPGKPAFDRHDILKLLESSPELAAINGGIERNEGLKKSLAKDQIEAQTKEKKM